MSDETGGREPSDPPTIAVTGAAGFIGSRVLNVFQSERPDWELVAIDNQFRGQVNSVGDVEIEHVDVRDRRCLEESLEGVDVVIHLAAVSGVGDCNTNPDLAYEVNVTGTNNVAWFCRRTGTALAFPFSMAVLGDPEGFPITAEQSRSPMNWYGRTKLLNERAIETFAEGAFPAHQFLKSNLYGQHVVDGATVGKPTTVIHFFVDRAVEGETLTVYEPGTQSRNFVHVKDVAGVYLASVERLLGQLDAGETGATTYEVGSDEDPSVMAVAEIVQELAVEELGASVDVELVENPRPDETTVEDFTVDTSRIRSDLGWEPTADFREEVRSLLRNQA